MATDSLHVSGAARQLTQSRGNYSAWAKRRQQQQLTHEREVESKQRMIKELRDYKPLGSTPKAMKIFKSKEKQADKLDATLRYVTLRRPQPYSYVSFRFVTQADKLDEELRELNEGAAALTEDAEQPMSLKAGGETAGFAVQIKGVGFGYPPAADGEVKTLFKGVEM